MAVPVLQHGVPPDIAEEMRRLVRAGYNIVPLGGGDDGKSPLCPFTDPPPLGRCLGLMKAYRSMMYGICLDDLVVVDADEVTPEIEDLVEARFGRSRVQTATPRGRHWYYRGPLGARPNLRAEGLPIDIKSGPKEYVCGPGAVRPDGGHYIPLSGALGVTDLRPFRDSQPADPSTPSVPEGARHGRLVRAAIQMVPNVCNASELAANLSYLRDTELADPETVSDAEISGVAQWAWEKRMANSIFAGRDSSFRFRRDILDLLKPLPNASDSIALLAILTDQHGHRPEAPFPLNWPAMKKAGHTDLSRRRFRDARNSLLSVGVLVKTGNHSPGRFCQSFRLARPMPSDVLPLGGRA